MKNMYWVSEEPQVDSADLAILRVDNGSSGAFETDLNYDVPMETELI